jgi:hypothetical protein
MGIITNQDVRESDARDLAKVAADRQPRCEHIPGGYIAGTSLRMCAKPECRQMVQGNDLFAKRPSSNWMREKG